MAIPRRIQKFLEKHGARYEHTIHAPAFTAQQLAHTEHVPESQVAKTVVFVGDDCYAIALLPANERVELTKLRAALGLTEVRLASESELRQLFPECEVGAMPPLGSLYGLPVYMDDDLAAQEFIEFNAGAHTDTLRMRLEEFTRLVKPVRTRFAELTAA
jgi:Ala-tRNA(Pro) deacylase